MSGSSLSFWNMLKMREWQKKRGWNKAMNWQEWELKRRLKVKQPTKPTSCVSRLRNFEKTPSPEFIDKVFVKCWNPTAKVTWYSCKCSEKERRIILRRYKQFEQQPWHHLEGQGNKESSSLENDFSKKADLDGKLKVRGFNILIKSF